MLNLKARALTTGPHCGPGKCLTNHTVDVDVLLGTRQSILNLSFFVLTAGSCLLLAAKFNDDMKREKVKELIEVSYFDMRCCMLLPFPPPPSSPPSRRKGYPWIPLQCTYTAPFIKLHYRLHYMHHTYFPPNPCQFSGVFWYQNFFYVFRKF